MCYEPRTELECLRTMYEEILRDLVTLRDNVTDQHEFSDREQIASHLDTLVENLKDEHGPQARSFDLSLIASSEGVPV